MFIIKTMKTKLWIPSLTLLIVSIVALSAGCAQVTTQLTSTGTITSPTTDVPTITTQDAYLLIQNNLDDPDFIILDVRTADEFNSGHIAGAVNLDYYSSEFRTNVGKLDQSKQYLVYCRTGIRGAASVRIMLDLGFKNVQNMTGGITQWTQDGYPTAK
jgi:rhodanese-related sulfurtransferase